MARFKLFHRRKKHKEKTADEQLDEIELAMVKEAQKLERERRKRGRAGTVLSE